MGIECNWLPWVLRIVLTATDWQRLQKTATRCSQKLPFVAKSAICCQKLPFHAKSCHLLPKVTSCSQMFPFVAKSCLLLPKVARCKLSVPATKCWQIKTSIKRFVRFWGGGGRGSSSRHKTTSFITKRILPDFEGGGAPRGGVYNKP